jgi:hypothetical protein
VVSLKKKYIPSDREAAPDTFSQFVVSPYTIPKRVVDRKVAETKLNKLHSENLLAIYDVVLDIEQERQLNPDRIAIPIMRQIIRFTQLMPADSIGLRDKYCESRWKAIKFLEKIGVVHDVNPLEGNHRWETYIELQPDLSEFPKFYDTVRTEYSRRTGAKSAGGIEKALAHTPTKVSAIHGKEHNTLDAPALATLICSRFCLVARQLQERHDGRSTLQIEDEYDVQDLLHSLLRLHFDDIRPEEWTPSYAGGSARMDFLLKAEQIVIEAKIARPGRDAKKISDELIVDAARYKEHPDCRMLVCFVYDPEKVITNPRGVESDLRKSSGPRLQVIAIIAP